MPREFRMWCVQDLINVDSPEIAVDENDIAYMQTQALPEDSDTDADDSPASEPTLQIRTAGLQMCDTPVEHPG